jgi:ribosome biogenesis protein Tsr3
MITHLWAIDTPWAKKGTEYKHCNHAWAGLYVNECRHGEPKQCSVQDLINIGWIKPVEDKKLTEEEILEKIANYTEVHYKDGTKEIVGETRISAVKLAKLLAEHLK